MIHESCNNIQIMHIREMHAVYFGLSRFSDYCYGRFVTVESDHKAEKSLAQSKTDF